MRRNTEDRIRKIVHDELTLVHEALAYLVSVALANCQCDDCKTEKAKPEPKTPVAVELRVGDEKTGQYL